MSIFAISELKLSLLLIDLVIYNNINCGAPICVFITCVVEGVLREERNQGIAGANQLQLHEKCCLFSSL